jgi:hypothetical protein
MTTWGDLLADLREDLQDTSTTNPRYSSKLLYLYARDAVADYSQYFPIRVDARQIAPVNKRYPLPDNFVDEVFVECPRGFYLTPRPIRPGIVKVGTTTPFRYEIESGGIYLDAATTQSIWLTYYATHDVPTSETDTSFEYSIPPGDMELIRLYVRARIAAQIRSRQANLDRYKEDGRRDDNPLGVEYSSLMDEYHLKIQQRTHTSAIWLIHQ